MAAPIWYEKAHQEMGVAEVPGPESNPRIQEYYASVGHTWVKDDSKQPWCGYFLAFLFQDRALPDEPWRARAWATWGDELSKPVPGAIGVMGRTDNPALGHVFLFVQFSKDGKFVYGLGGNQGNKVCIERFPTSKVIAWRWPKGERLPTGSDLANGSRIKREAKELVGVGGATVATGVAGKTIDIPAPPTETLTQVTSWQPFMQQIADFVVFLKTNWMLAAGVLVCIAGARIYRWRTQDAKEGKSWAF